MPNQLTPREQELIEIVADRTAEKAIDRVLAAKSVDSFISTSKALELFPLTRYRLLALREEGKVEFKQGEGKNSKVLYSTSDLQKYFETSDNGLSSHRS